MRRFSRCVRTSLILASALLLGFRAEAAEKVTVGITGTHNALG